MGGLFIPNHGYEIRFPDETPTKSRIETIKRFKYALIRESELNEDDIFIEAWQEKARSLGEEDMNVIRLYVITPEILN